MPLTRDGLQSFEVNGDSMRFLLRSGDRVLVRRADPSELRLGDIIVFLKDLKDPVVHRVVWKTGRNGSHMLWTRGDALPRLDAPIPPASLIGKAVAVDRGGRRIDLEASSARWAHWVIGASSSIYFLTEYPERLRAWASSRFRAARRRLRDAVAGLYPLLADQPAAARVRALLVRAFRVLEDDVLARPGVIRGVVHWKGVITLVDDVVVPRGARLTLEPGTVVRTSSDGVGREEFTESIAFGRRRALSGGGRRNIIVFGELVADGTRGGEIRFEGATGVVALGGAVVSLREARFEAPGGAAVRAADFSRVSLTRCRVLGGGVAECGGFSEVRLRAVDSQGGSLAVRLDDDARLFASGVRITEASIGVEAVRNGSVYWRAGAFVRCADAASVAGHSRFRDAASDWEANGSGLRLDGRARARLVLSRFRANEGSGLSLHGRSRAECRGASFSGHRREPALFAADRAQVEATGGSFEANVTAAALVCRARLSGRGGHWRENELALSADDRSRATLVGGAMADNASGARARQSARIDLLGTAFTRQRRACASTEGESRIRVLGGSMCLSAVGVSARDASRLEARSVRLEGNEVAAWCRDDSSLRLDASSILGGGVGLKAEGRARVRARWASLRDVRSSAVFLCGDSRARLEQSSIRGSGAGAEVLGASRLIAKGCRFAGNGVGVWTQNRGGTGLEQGEFVDNEIALKASHGSAALLFDLAMRGQGKAGLFIEDEARVRLSRIDLEGNQNGALVLHRATLDAQACRLARCADTAVWSDHRSTVRLSGGAFDSNKIDVHVERRPSY
ncbi:MAG: S24/S26 family peptidase [Elusimicrobia bacterium]|nr:S24/S26 family peptidase [Elusimicrobiota bacterium]